MSRDKRRDKRRKTHVGEKGFRDARKNIGNPNLSIRPFLKKEIKIDETYHVASSCGP